MHLERIRQHLRSIFDDEAVHFLRCTQAASGTRHVERVSISPLPADGRGGGRARDIHRDIATADDDDALARLRL